MIEVRNAIAAALMGAVATLAAGATFADQNAGGESGEQICCSVGGLGNSSYVQDGLSGVVFDVCQRKPSNSAVCTIKRRRHSQIPDGRSALSR